MTNLRDQQRARCYRAEDEAFGHDVSRTEKLKMAQLRKELARIQAAPWFAEVAPLAPATIELEAKGSGHCITTGNRIRFPKWARNIPTLLHELAHLATPRDEGHGPEWAYCFRQLVARELGEDAAAKLQRSMAKHGVLCLEPQVVEATRSAARRGEGWRPRRLQPGYWLTSKTGVVARLRRVRWEGGKLIKGGGRRYKLEIHGTVRQPMTSQTVWTEEALLSDLDITWHRHADRPLVAACECAYCQEQGR